MRSLGYFLFTAALLSCSRLPEQNPPKAPSALPAGAVPPGAPAVPWSKKTRSDRMEFMGLFFFPKMKAIFQAHDPRAYAQFRCQTCHGRDMEAVNFKMPNGLYALPVDEPEKAALTYDEKTAKFMADEVAPASENLLGIAPAAGPSCHLCHDKE